MPPSVRASSTGDTGGSGTTKTITLPTNVSGDGLYIGLVDDAPSQTFTTPGGWSRLADSVAIESGNNQATFLLIRKTSSGSEPSTVDITTSISELSVWIVFSVQNDGGLDGAAVVNNGGSSSSASVPAITTGVADALIIGIVATDGVTTTHGTPSGYTRIDERSLASGGSVSANYQVVASPTTIAAETSSLTASEQWRGWAFSIAPAAVNGALSVTLGALTSSGAGTVAVAGTASPTLGALTTTAAATKPIVGSGAPTLGIMTFSAAGLVVAVIATYGIVHGVPAVGAGIRLRGQ